MKILTSKIRNEEPLPELKSYQSEFLQDRLKSIDKLKQAIINEDYTYLMSIMHQWAGYAKPYGFNYLEEIGLQLQISAEIKDNKSCQKYLDLAENYLNLKKNILN